MGEKNIISHFCFISPQDKDEEDASFLIVLVFFLDSFKCVYKIQSTP